MGGDFVTRESTFRPALLLMAGRTFASAATLLIPVTLVRVFDRTEYGTYKQLFLVFATLYSIALVGLSDSLYYFIPGTRPGAVVTWPTPSPVWYWPVRPVWPACMRGAMPWPDG